MKNRGFTLVELLGVIVLLVLLAMITIPTIGSAIKNGKEKADKQTKENIVLAARNWAVDNKSSLPKETNQKISVTIDQLQESGYLDKNIEMPSTGNVITGTCVDITNITKTESVKKQYDYKYNENC